MRLKRCVAVAGTHGKTTTTSLVATLIDAAGMDPTVINGGIINAYGTNARLGAGDWMVVEADESDGTFLKLPADIVVVTNIDPEHLDHFKYFRRDQGRVSGADRKPALLRFRRHVPRSSDGAGNGRPLNRGPSESPTYGENPQADVRPHGRRSCRRSHPVFGAHSRAGDRTGDLYSRSRAADAGAPQRAQRDRGDRRCPRTPGDSRRHSQGDRELRRRQAAFHPHRRGGTASRSTTTTAIIRSKSPRCSRRRERRPAAR